MILPRRPKKPVVKRTVYVAGRRTGMRLEDEFWEGLVETAKERGVSASALVTIINADRGHANLSSAVRLFVLKRYQMQHKPRA
jgi:predicted DNA-binding ribbon-helix-helix protein